MIKNKIIESILILIVMLGYFKATGDVLYDGDRCSEDYMTGPFCNISCDLKKINSCSVSLETCTGYKNDTILCHCINGSNATCTFVRCDDVRWCEDNGYCYIGQGSDANKPNKCICKEDYRGVMCAEKQSSSTTSSTQQTTITETITQTTPTESSTQEPPVVEGQDPTYPAYVYGPYAGGTKVVINGTNLDGIKDIFLHVAVTILNRSDEALEILTPPYINASEVISVSIPFKYNVTWQTGDIIVTDLNFIYKPNPTVSDINPKKAIISGGTSVTVTGTNFDSVASPKFKVYVRERINNDNDNATLIEILDKKCKHKDRDNTQLLCRFPNIASVLPSRRKRFVEKANNLGLRKTREAPTTDQLQFTLGLEFDGADHYEDLADSNPRLGFIDVHPDPKFQSDQKILFDPAVAKVIGIKGEDIDSGTVVEDYKIYIGDAVCTDIGLTFDKLYCSPPENIDDIKDRGSDRRPNEANVTVHIGINLRHYVGFITYNTEDPTVPLYTLFIPVVAAIGGVVLLLFIILIVCACRNSDAKDEPLTAPSVTDIDNMAPTGNDNYYTGQTAPKDQYYMVVNKDDRRKGSLPPPDKSAVDGRI